MQNVKSTNCKVNLRLLYPRYEVYLRNKETQQTLRVVVSIQYDASF